MRSPAQLWRYLLAASGGSYRERYARMSPAEKEVERWRSMKRNGLFLAFVDMKTKRRKKPYL
ncbi:MAG TPA: hypothetical protein VLJ80_00915 [Solirubrobacteraceae bacterium]|nr:hypothetical protein [Solirubrobacteraceae bacterium]